jgi:hypothetical protein
MSPRFGGCLPLGAAVTLALAVVSCSKSPSSPTPGGQAGTFVSVRVVAPDQIAPGASAQLTASAVRSDGAAQDVTSQAQWTVQPASTGSVVLTVSATGVVTGQDPGRAVVTLRVAGLTADTTILVLPAGTFRLAGKITDGGVALDNVTVAVIAGVGQGLTTHTDASGSYELYGVAGPVQVRASKDGYTDKAQQIDVSAHASLAIELQAYRPSDSLAGTYALILAGSSCSPGFPEAFTRRVYAATVEQKGADVRVTLSGADFWPGENAFGGVVAPTGEVRFVIHPESFWDEFGDVVERLNNGDLLVFGGVILARRTPAGISGQFLRDNGNNGFIRMNLAPGNCILDRFEMVPR